MIGYVAPSAVVIRRRRRRVQILARGLFGWSVLVCWNRWWIARKRNVPRVTTVVVCSTETGARAGTWWKLSGGPARARYGPKTNKPTWARAATHVPHGRPSATRPHDRSLTEGRPSPHGPQQMWIKISETALPARLIAPASLHRPDGQCFFLVTRRRGYNLQRLAAMVDDPKSSSTGRDHR